jgi:hypothetical protein
MENEKLTFETIGGRVVRHIEKKEPVDFSDISGARVGSVSDLLKQVHGATGRIVVRPASATPAEEEDSDE